MTEMHGLEMIGWLVAIVGFVVASGELASVMWLLFGFFLVVVGRAMHTNAQRKVRAQSPRAPDKPATVLKL